MNQINQTKGTLQKCLYRHPVYTLPLYGGGRGWGWNGEDHTPIPTFPPQGGRGILACAGMTNCEKLILVQRFPKTHCKPALSHMTGRGSPSVLRSTPTRLVLIIAFSIFTIESGIMALLYFLPPLASWVETVIDATLLITLLTNVLFFFKLPR